MHRFSMTICAAAALLTASSPVGAHHPSGLPGSGSSGIVTIPGTTLTSGVRLTSNDWSGFISVGLPIANDLNGIQSEAQYRLSGGGSVSF